MLKELTVIIPTYKAEKTISRTIESIIAENVLPDNIIVVEDGVYDDTKKVIDKYNIKHIIQNENLGAPAARNRGLQEVETKYVMFIDSDDFVSTNLIKGLVESAKKYNADISFGPWRMDGEIGEPSQIRQPPQLEAQDWVFYWLNNECVPTCSVLWKTSKVREIGAWDERLKKNQDGEITIRGLMNCSILSISTQGYSTYWQHNSEFRVSNSHINNRLYASDVVYKNILSWLENNMMRQDYQKRLGQFCCNVAWHAQSENKKIEAQNWLNRAFDLGYTSKGYNKPTKYISKLFGFNLGVKIKKLIKTITN